MTEPQGELARYAFGYSNKKPSKTFWIILAIMTIIAIGGCFHVV